MNKHEQLKLLQSARVVLENAQIPVGRSYFIDYGIGVNF